MELPKNTYDSYSTLKSELKKGRIKIPQFQREFVWDIKKAAELVDSVIKGYPVGSFITWKTKESLRFIKNIGVEGSFDDTPEGDFVDYVLDGQQRLTSLYAAFEGVIVNCGKNKGQDFSDICIDLEAEEDEDIVVVSKPENRGNTKISISEIAKGDYSLSGKVDAKYLSKLSAYANIIKQYQFSIISIKDAEIDVATEIFTRLNVGGKKLTIFEIMVAKTYDADKNFDLSEKFEVFRKKLKKSGYETIPDILILQLISLILAKECKGKIILSLQKEAIIKIWDNVLASVECAVDFFKKGLGIPVAGLLPYNALVIPIAYYFYENKNNNPSGQVRQRLEQFFWRCSLTSRYTSGLESKLAQDIKKIDDILKGRSPDYDEHDWAVNTTPEFIASNGYFRPTRSYIKAILCLYASFKPQSLKNGIEVELGNDSLRKSNSKNFHHFFPKAYLKERGFKDERINNILNITMVTEKENKGDIRDKAPSDYIELFQSHNVALDQHLKSHLIYDLKEFGVLDNDFDSFMKMRAEKVSEELTRRVGQLPVDQMGQSVSQNDDFYEVEDVLAA